MPGLPLAGQFASAVSGRLVNTQFTSRMAQMRLTARRVSKGTWWLGEARGDVVPGMARTADRTRIGRDVRID